MLPTVRDLHVNIEEQAKQYGTTRFENETDEQFRARFERFLDKRAKRDPHAWRRDQVTAASRRR